MKILYSAIDQTVPGTKGGSVHVQAVAEGLAALGHEVTALITPGDGRPPGAVRWVPLPPPGGITQLRLARARAVKQIVNDLQPDAILERYHNFGGEAIRNATRIGAVGVLEVNAPVIDYPGSGKARLDRLLIAEPMRRWREHLCDVADVIVTPNPAILPPSVPRSKVAVLEWGADTDRFRPDVHTPPPFTRPDVRLLAVFAGAFRSWHGAIHLATALRHLHASGRTDIGTVFIGDGPELPSVREAARGLSHVLFTGALSHDAMPAALAATDVGVAPFDVGAHAPLALGFYWSPLKVFEYMAAGLPVVAPAVDRLPSLVSHDREGVLYDARQPHAIADALLSLSDPQRREAMAVAARARAVRDYSWTAHCRALEAAILDRRGRT